MKKRLNLICALLCTMIALHAAAAKNREAQYITHSVQAPFSMEPIKEYIGERFFRDIIIGNAPERK